MTAPFAVLVDFDGTITNGDTFDVLVRAFAGEDAFARDERGLVDGSMTLRAVLERQTERLRGTFAEFVAILEREVAVDPTFATFAATCRARAIPLTIVSSGLRGIIERRMAAIGCGDLPIVANELVASGDGWRIAFRDTDAPNGTDKVAVVAATRARGYDVVFVGDGRSDFDAALVADVRFAKRGRSLERFLVERGASCVGFTTFAEIASALFDERTGNVERTRRP